jgi:hypothetical protein
LKDSFSVWGFPKWCFDNSSKASHFSLSSVESKDQFCSRKKY